MYILMRCCVASIDGWGSQQKTRSDGGKVQPDKLTSVAGTVVEGCSNTQSMLDISFSYIDLSEPLKIYVNIYI